MKRILATDPAFANTITELVADQEWDSEALWPASVYLLRDENLHTVIMTVACEGYMRVLESLQGIVDRKLHDKHDEALEVFRKLIDRPGPGHVTLSLEDLRKEDDEC